MSSTIGGIVGGGSVTPPLACAACCIPVTFASLLSFCSFTRWRRFASCTPCSTASTNSMSLEFVGGNGDSSPLNTSAGSKTLPSISHCCIVYAVRSLSAQIMRDCMACFGTYTRCSPFVASYAIRTAVSFVPSGRPKTTTRFVCSIFGSSSTAL